MKYFMLATATAVTLLGPAIADTSFPAPKGDVAGVKIRAGASLTAEEIAMGPTSAAHLPGGTGTQPQNPPASCTLPPDQCPKQHKRPRHRHRRIPPHQS
jgi:hypothetical protein